ncbi:restriction endonuclease subunit S [Bacillus toyonensis]|uniref:Type I restriction endonuclease subunit R n=1 Tax=Bacillus toyonensis TaxID=155322 RepID=A0AB36SPK3_9BACI|nr:restriction endonuclease subunit S [Bacillus toyonensis]PEK15725.1 type I restriction endonuclease subunit R [Bacillus toyonensis]PEN55858.1 type I restriction endonuclease subunit R [Bacillus toyonensis]PGC83589.1 type I restriction endonuclease subunit R [Bacillus toyonensis]PHA11261.1 type I restriction endonuclease subunit R [Bacillus toyonensis]
MIIKKTVGELIDYVDERNVDSFIMDFYGININKEFMPTVANIDTVDPKKYKVVRKNRFVFSGMQTGRDKTIRIGLFIEDNPIIVSPAYTTFEIKDERVILPEYFFMLFLRNESDRYGWFISDSSVRANLDLDRFEEISFDLPPIEVQEKYVKIYRAISRVPDLKAQIKDICPILISGAIKEAKGRVKV